MANTHICVKLHLLRWVLAASVIVSTGLVSRAAGPDVLLGKEIFEHEWTHASPPKLEQGNQNRFQFESRLRLQPGDGLGPMFNATSCEACHAGGGASGVERNVTLITIDPRSPMLKARSAEELEAAKQSVLDLYPGMISPLGVLSVDVVLHESSSRPLFQLVRDKIRDYVPGGISDEWYKSDSRKSDVIAEQPVIAGRKDDIDFYLSQRNSPPLFGLDLIDKIERPILQRIARSQERRSGGKISGRLGTGKFGWRAQTVSLDAFVRGACAGELGLQLSLTPQPTDVADETYVSLGTDLTEPQVAQLVSYVRSLPYPMQETKIAQEALRAREGKRLFAKIGCNACHVENMYPARGIYSDLLLHDMGSLLQAPSPASLGVSNKVRRLPLPFFRPENPPLGSGRSIGGYYGLQSRNIPTPYAFDRPEQPVFPVGQLTSQQLNPNNEVMAWDVLQREWRTPPLWGVADSAPYLHDGRATTLDAAIRWHGGESKESVSAYRSLPSEMRKDLIAFLRALRSPPTPQREDAERIAKGKAKLQAAPKLVSKSQPVDKGSLEEALQMFEQSF